MKKLALFVSIILLIFSSSCKRSCYQCTQYCAYCILTADTSVTSQVCAQNGSGENRVDSILIAMRDSGYSCNFLNAQKNVCDGKHSIVNAVNYYLKQGYYCNPAN